MSLNHAIMKIQNFNKHHYYEFSRKTKKVAIYFLQQNSDYERYVKKPRNCLILNYHGTIIFNLESRQRVC